MKNEKLSIITPVLNGKKFIEKNIQSIKKLSIPYEHIIIDGGSTDGTLDLLSKEQSIRILHQTKKTGMYGAIDIGFKNATGNYICWVNCDDTIDPNGYDKLYQFVIKNNIDFISSDGIIKNIQTKNQKLVRSTRFVKFFLSKGFFPFIQPSTIYSKELYIKVNGLNYDHFKICGDLDLFYRMAKVKEARFAYLPIITSVFLLHGNSLGDKNSDKALEEQKYSSIPSKNVILRAILKGLRLFNI